MSVLHGRFKLVKKEIKIAASKVPAFKAVKALRDAVKCRFSKKPIVSKLRCLVDRHCLLKLSYDSVKKKKGSTDEPSFISFRSCLEVRVFHASSMIA